MIYYEISFNSDKDHMSPPQSLMNISIDSYNIVIPSDFKSRATGKRVKSCNPLI
jgi:hypothetical protein